MSFCHRLRTAADAAWQRCFDHPFVTGIGDGTLSIERFQFYLLQDYLYLYDYAKVFALGLLKAESPALMQLFSGSIDAILNGEMNTHRAYMKRLGITDLQAEQATMALDCKSYTSYMLAAGHSGGVIEVLTAILACAWSYAEIGERLEAIPGASEHPFYGEWIKSYASEEYQALNRTLMEQLDALVVQENLPEERLASLERIFVDCSRLEEGFWEMSWQRKL